MIFSLATLCPVSYHLDGVPPSALLLIGWSAVSRNPIYLVSIFGMVGLAIAINSIYVTWLLLRWAAMYILAPFAEESWLAKEYGNSYREYCDRVPRFFGRIQKT